MKTRRPLLLAFLAYAFLAFLWIVLSDWLLPSLLENSAYLNVWQALKGIVPLTLTALLFYFLDHRQLAERGAHAASLRQAAAVFDSTLEGVLITDAEQRIIYINRAFTRITGYTETEVMGQLPTLLKSGRHDGKFYRKMWQALSRRSGWSGEIWNRRKTGEVYPQWQSIRAIRDEAGTISHYVAVFSDLSMLKRSQAELDHLAHYDPLTGLPNRLLFKERIQHALERVRLEKGQGAVLLLDLDHFKHINESLGHRLGDQLLKTVSQRLTSRVMRQGMTLAHLGGDEFGLLCGNCQPQQAATLAMKILDILNQPVHLDQHNRAIA